MPFRFVRVLWTLFLVALLSGCFGPKLPKPEPNDPLIGIWRGEDFQPVFKKRSIWYMDRKSDGTFTIEFRTTEAERELPIQTEEGIWSHKAGLYRTITTKVAGVSVNASDPQYTDEYEVKSVNQEEMIYFHPRTKLEFKSKRVGRVGEAP